MKAIAFFGIIILNTVLTACGQTPNKRYNLGKGNAEKELEKALTDRSQHNVVSNEKMLIKNNSTAISVVEPILFGIYGKDNIVKQRPYDVYLINNYWIISGILPRDYLGGTFLIIMNAKNGEVIRLTHGK